MESGHSPPEMSELDDPQPPLSTEIEASLMYRPTHITGDWLEAITAVHYFIRHALNLF